MRTKDEIIADIKRMQTAKRNAERKRGKCIERIRELKYELAAALEVEAEKC